MCPGTAMGKQAVVGASRVRHPDAAEAIKTEPL
jgi:hypothetical protein